MWVLRQCDKSQQCDRCVACVCHIDECETDRKGKKKSNAYKRQQQKSAETSKEWEKNEKSMCLTERLCACVYVCMLQIQTNPCYAPHKHTCMPSRATSELQNSKLCMQTTANTQCNCINKQKTNRNGLRPLDSLPCHLCRAAIKSSSNFIALLRFYRFERCEWEPIHVATISAFFSSLFHSTEFATKTTCANTLNGIIRNGAAFVLVRQTPYPSHFQHIAGMRQLAIPHGVVVAFILIALCLFLCLVERIFAFHSTQIWVSVLLISIVCYGNILRKNSTQC